MPADAFNSASQSCLRPYRGHDLGEVVLRIVASTDDLTWPIHGPTTMSVVLTVKRARDLCGLSNSGNDSGLQQEQGEL